jgi:hypothetical protein
MTSRDPTSINPEIKYKLRRKNRLMCAGRVEEAGALAERIGKDHLRPTATGLDGLPAWFLRLGTPVFCQPIAYLFSLSRAMSTIPQQWKQASILPIPKSLPPK